MTSNAVAAPPRLPRRRLKIISAIVWGLCEVSRRTSPCTWLGIEAKGEAAVEGYVLFWAVAVSLFLTFCPPGGGPIPAILLAVALFRLQELVFASLDSALLLTQNRIEEKHRFENVSLAIIFLVSVFQVAVIFALIYYVLTSPRAWSQPPHPWGHWSCAFLGWTNLTPFTIGVHPLSTRARALAVFESVTAVMLIGIALSRFLSVRDWERQKPHLWQN